MNNNGMNEKIFTASCLFSDQQQNQIQFFFVSEKKMQLVH